MSRPLETDLSKIVQKERKEGIKRVATVLGFAVGLVGLGYAFSPNYYQQELQENYTFCIKLVDKASGNTNITDFVYEQISIPEGLHSARPVVKLLTNTKKSNKA